jgi:pseudouridylate synthase
VSGAVIRDAASVARARASGAAIVALESSVLAQGLPIPANRSAHTRMAAAVRDAGAFPAVTAVVHGVPMLGLEDAALERFLAREGVRKASARDLAHAMATGADAATTVAATLAIAHSAGVGIMATGGIGGVHHDAPFDESADLVELSRTPVVVVCAGIKSILDVPATLERLETLGVPVVGYGIDEFPGFYSVGSGVPVPTRVDDLETLAALVRAHRALGRRSGILVVRPPPPDSALPRAVVDAAVDEARAQASSRRVSGAMVTPFLLDAVSAATGGGSLAANLALLEANAALAGRLASHLANRGRGVGH